VQCLKSKCATFKLFPQLLESWLKEEFTDTYCAGCGGYPGAFGYELLDATTFSSWGFEYLKVDGCNMPTGTEQEYKAVYGHWHQVLTIQKPPLVFSQSAPAYFAEAANLTDWYSVMGWVREYGQVSGFT